MPKRPREKEGYKLSRDYSTNNRLAVFRPNGNSIVFITKEIDALFDALVRGNAAAFRALTKKEANYKDSCGQSLLARAIELGDAKIVETLIARGANVNWQDANGNSILQIAAEEGDYKIITILRNSGASSTHINNDGISTLYLLLDLPDYFDIQEQLDNDVIENIEILFRNTVYNYNYRLLNLLEGIDSSGLFESLLIDLYNEALESYNLAMLNFISLSNLGKSLLEEEFTIAVESYNSNKANLLLGLKEMSFKLKLESLFRLAIFYKKFVMLEFLLSLENSDLDVDAKLFHVDFTNGYSALQFVFKRICSAKDDDDDVQQIKILLDNGAKNLGKDTIHFHFSKSDKEPILYYNINLYKKLDPQESFSFLEVEHSELFLEIARFTNNVINGRDYTNKIKTLLSSDLAYQYFVSIISFDKNANKILHNLFKKGIFADKIIPLLDHMSSEQINNTGVMHALCNKDISKNIKERREEFIEEALKRGADINHKLEFFHGCYKDFTTPLFEAIYYPELLESLIVKYGADIHVSNLNRNNVFDIIVQKNLKKKDSSYQGNKGNTILGFKDFLKPYETVFKHLILKGLKPRDHYSRNPKVISLCEDLTRELNQDSQSFFQKKPIIDNDNSLSNQNLEYRQAFALKLGNVLEYSVDWPIEMIGNVGQYFSYEDAAEFSSVFPLLNKKFYKNSGGERLSDTFINHGLTVIDVARDGNCFFHAVARQLEILNNGEQVMTIQELRAFAVNYIRNNQDEFAGFIDNEETIEEYLARISQHGQWADNPLIEALVREIGVNIVIINNAHIDQPNIIGNAFNQDTIYLGHLGEAHYVSLEEALGEVNVARFQELENQVRVILAQQNPEDSDSDDSVEEEALDDSEECDNYAEGEESDCSDESEQENDKLPYDSDDYMEDENESDYSTDYYTEDDLDYSSEEDERALDNPIQVVDFDHSSPLTAAVGVVLLGIQTSNTHHD